MAISALEPDDSQADINQRRAKMECGLKNAMS